MDLCTKNLQKTSMFDSCLLFSDIRHLTLNSKQKLQNWDKHTIQYTIKLHKAI